MSDKLNSHEAKVMLYVFGLLDEMTKNDMVSGGTHRITDSGREQYETLKASGFRPSKEDIHAAMTFLQSKAEVEAAR